jgi:hypothetical protein
MRKRKWLFVRVCEYTEQDVFSDPMSKLVSL